MKKWGEKCPHQKYIGWKISYYAKNSRGDVCEGEIVRIPYT